jgi:hypothetical protein
MPALLATALLTGCTSGVLVSRGSSVPLELQRMSGDQLHEYFKARGDTGYNDGSAIEASVVMVDLAYLKATGQTMEASEDEMAVLTSQKRFEAHIEYSTHNLFPGETEQEGIAFEKWTVLLHDSKGNELEPSSANFEPPLVQKAATQPEPVLLDEEASKLLLTYILKGNLIFDYQVPEGCKWVELTFEPPQTGHKTKVRWTIGN